MLAVNQENEKLMEEYEKLASEVRLGSHCALPILALLTLPTLLTPSVGLQSLPLLRVALASSNPPPVHLHPALALLPTQAPGQSLIDSSFIRLLLH